MRNFFLWISESVLRFYLKTCFSGSAMYYKFNSTALHSLLAHTFRSLKYYFSKHWTLQFHRWQVRVSSSKVLQNPDAEKMSLKLCIQSIETIYRHSSNAFEIKKKIKTNLWRSQIKALLGMTYILPRYFLAEDVAYFYFCKAFTFLLIKWDWSCSGGASLSDLCISTVFAGQHLMEVTDFLNTLCLYSCSVFFFLLLSSIRTESATSRKIN